MVAWRENELWEDPKGASYSSVSGRAGATIEPSPMLLNEDSIGEDDWSGRSHCAIYCSDYYTESINRRSCASCPGMSRDWDPKLSVKRLDPYYISSV
ncbi:hypothetical protein V6N13_016812 [Hibiscus sabdariffa]